MRRLILMRHAKSSWSDTTQRDLDRPLNKRGRRSAALVGDWLKSHHYRPGAALVSSARRAQQTWDGIVSAAGPAPTRYVPEIYHAGPDTLLDVLRQAPVGERTVLMLGHQPGIGTFARRLLREPPRDDSGFEKFPTAATAVIDFDAEDWRAVGWETGRLEAFVVPRTLE